MQIRRHSNTENPTGSIKIVEDVPTGTGREEKTPFENFEGLTTKLLRVPKEEVDEKRAEQEQEKKRAR